MNRRHFLGVGIATLGAACGERYASRTGTLRPSTLASERVAPLSEVRRLVVERADPVLGRCRYVADLGGRQVAQPILIARPGEAFDAVIQNALPQPTTVHFHGLTLPESADGAGFDPIGPGGRKRLRFEVHNRSGLYWFHPHPHGYTAEQVHSGLVGLLIVADGDDRALDSALAIAPGNRLALAVADARFEGGVLRPYAPTAEDCLHGWLGNRALVNGALDAEFAVAPGWVRVQLLNACNARGLLLAWRDGKSLLPFHLLGTDGGLLGEPREIDRVFLYGGERVDLAINLAGRRAVDAVSLEFDPRHHHTGSMPARHGHDHGPLAAGTLCEGAAAGPGSALPDGAELPLFTLRVEGSPADRFPALPARLSTLPPAEQFVDAPTRRVRLDFDERSGFLIDQTPYRRDEVGFTVKRGTAEVWEIKNSPISMPHAMHLHGFGFRVLRRQGTFGAARALAAERGARFATDLGVKDTVLLWPNETVWLAVDFTLPDQPAFHGAQRYMFHCHNLEHEDAMMMRNFTVL